MSSSEREFEVVVWGATGFTGRLVVEHLSQHFSYSSPSLRWALGGRDRTKLERVAGELNSPAELPPILVGDSFDRPRLDEIARRTSVICSTVGPYARYGSALVAACVEHGTHYCDLSGEIQWMREMIDRHEAQARQTGARIVHCCGFDSIPSDLGCYFLQQYVRAEHDVVCRQIKMRVRKMRGAFSGGTVASLLNVLDESRRDSRVRRILQDPYALNPPKAREGPDGLDRYTVQWDRDLCAWTAPFLMAPINTRVVRRTNALLNYQYGRDFRYDEAVLTSRGLMGWVLAQSVSKGLKLFFSAAAIQPTRAVLERCVLPSPGQGPSAVQRERGAFEIQLVGKSDVAASDYWSALVTGERDPGYGTTAKMLAETLSAWRRISSLLGVVFGRPPLVLARRQPRRL